MKVARIIIASILFAVTMCNIHTTMETETPNKIQIIDSSELSSEVLCNRNGNILIEKCIGVVTSTEGDGEILNCHSADYNYISYKGIDKANVGDKILTYFIYNPETNHIDDILYRFDYIVE